MDLPEDTFTLHANNSVTLTLHLNPSEMQILSQLRMERVEEPLILSLLQYRVSRKLASLGVQLGQVMDRIASQ